jgi:hypothetical protein
MDGNLLYADRSCIDCVNVFHARNRCISFCVNPINPAWKHNAMCRDLDHQYFEQGAHCGGRKLD